MINKETKFYIIADFIFALLATILTKILNSHWSFRYCVLTFLLTYVFFIVLDVNNLLIYPRKRGKVVKDIKDEIFYQGNSVYLKTLGGLFITKDRLIFKAFSSKKQTFDVEILTDNILRIIKCKNWKGIEIICNGQVYYFEVNAFDRNKIVKILNSLIS